MKELTRQLKEYQKNYEAVQEENREQEKKLTQIEAEQRTFTREKADEEFSLIQEEE